jgi:two-component system, OmpR family, sensor histidine kinase BaeS
MSLRARLTLSYVLVALFCVILVSALANGVLENRFRSYVRETQEQRNRQLVDLVGAQFRADGSWDEASIMTVGMNALEQGVIVKVTDTRGATVWDAMTHNNGLCEQMIAHMAANMASRYRGWKGTYTVVNYPVRSDFRAVGAVSIGYYGPFFLSDQDLSFINTLNRLLLWVTGGALAAALGIGLGMARGISVPLARVEAATLAIAGGNLAVRVPERSRTREIGRISAAVNTLATALQTQESLRRRLSADMAHEMRTPLATLQSHLEALIDGVWEPDQGRLTGLYNEILRINRMVADMENLARYEADTLSLQRERLEIGELAAGIVANHEPQFRAKGVELTLLREPGTVDVSADPDRLSQALINLLSNALKFTPAGGSVQVGVGAAGGAVLLKVTDTGIGIGPADLPHVFERFYRADSSRSRSTGGSGIGLSIAKAIAEAHGGTLTVTSSPGRGSEFTITLPLSAA